MTPEFIGQRIATAIRESGASREGIADAIGVSKETLQRYVRGGHHKEGTDPSALTVFRIAALTGKPIGWFAGEGDAVGDVLDRAILSELLRLLDDGQRMAARLRRTRS